MAEEATTQTGGSEGDQATAGAVTSGAPGDGSTSVTDSTATGDAVLAAERAKAEQVQRELQASRDRERAAREKLEAELTKLRGAASGEEAKPLTRDELFAALDERERKAALRQAASSLKGTDDFKHADKALFDRADQFDSVEAFRAALEASHASTKGVIDAAVEAGLQEKLEEAAKQYGFSVTPASKPPAANGDPSIEEINSTPLSEWDSKGWTDEVVDRVLRNAN